MFTIIDGTMVGTIGVLASITIGVTDGITGASEIAGIDGIVGVMDMVGTTGVGDMTHSGALLMVALATLTATHTGIMDFIIEVIMETDTILEV